MDKKKPPKISQSDKKTKYRYVYIYIGATESVENNRNS